MQGTRALLLEYIVHHRDARVEEMAAQLAITPVAVRRHLDHLRADGLVDVRTVKQVTGRPYYAYHATEQATQAVPPAYADLMERMLRSLGEHEDVVSGVAAGVAESLAERHRAEVAPVADDPEQLVMQVTATLKQDGILESWRAEADGYHLTNGACPYLKAAAISKLPCESDRRAIEMLLGQEVEQLHRIVDGAPCCEYLVHVRDERGHLIEIP